LTRLSIIVDKRERIEAEISGDIFVCGILIIMHEGQDIELIAEYTCTNFIIANYNANYVYDYLPVFPDFQ